MKRLLAALFALLTAVPVAQAATIEYTYTGATTHVAFANRKPLFAPSAPPPSGSFTLTDDNGWIEVVSASLSPLLLAGQIYDITRPSGGSTVHMTSSSFGLWVLGTNETDLLTFVPTQIVFDRGFYSDSTVVDPRTGNPYYDHIRLLVFLDGATVTSRVIPDAPTISAVPLPATAPLLGGGLFLAFAALRRRKRI